MKIATLLLFITLLNPLPWAADKPDQKSLAPAVRPSADTIWKELVDGNRRFVRGESRSPNYVRQRQKLAKGQQPKVAVLACADSRVAPEILFDQGLGELFVVRSAGNSANPIAIGSLEYAVDHLGSTVIVVLGHQSCGAVTAACSGEKMPTPNLEAVVRPILSSCRAPNGTKTDLDAAIRGHVRRTAEDLLQQSELLQHAVAQGKLTIIDAYYALDSGVVQRLPQ